MIVKTELNSNEIIDILKEQMDDMPSLIRCIITLNVHRYRGTSRVCGKIIKNGFQIRNRKDPYFSIIAEGIFSEREDGTEIDICFKKPKIKDIFGALFFKRYEDERNTIIQFLKDWLNIKIVTEQNGSQGFGG